MNGSRTRFRQDTDVASGPFLRELRLEAAGETDGAAPDAVRMLLQDIGDPSPRGRLDLAAEDLYSFSASAERQTRLGIASRDVHALDLDRDRRGARALLTPWGRAGPSFELAVERLHEEGDLLATSNFNIAEPFLPAPAPTAATRETFGGGTRFEWEGFEIALREIVARTGDRQSVSFEEPSAFTPGASNRLDRSTDAEGSAYATYLSVRRRLPGEVEVAFRGRYTDATRTDDLRSRESGVFAGMPFLREETGGARADGEAGEAEGSLSFPFSPGVRGTLFASHASSLADGDSRIEEIFESPPGSPMLLVRENAHRERRTANAGGLDVDAEATRGVHLRGGAQFGREHFGVRVQAFNNTIVDTEGRLTRLLLHGGVTLRPEDTLSIDLDLRRERYGTFDEFFRETQARGWGGEARTRWNPAGPLSFGGAVRVGRSTVDLFARRNRIRAAELEATFAPGPAASASVLVSRTEEDLAATPVVLVGFAPVRETLAFDAATDLFAGLFEFLLDPRTRLRSEASFARARGSAHVTRWVFGEQVERELRPRLTVGGGVRRASYETDAPTSERGYSAFVADLFVRFTF